MAAADNPFYVKPVNAMEALMSGYQGYEMASKRAKQQELEQAYKDVGGQLSAGGELSTSALGRLIGLGPEAAPMVTAAAAFKKATEGGTDDIKEYQFAKQQGYAGTLADWMAHKRAGAGELGLNPIWTTGPDGKPAPFQPSKTGDPKRMNFPAGYQPSRDHNKVDLGTAWGILNPTSGEIMSVVPKDVAGQARQKEIGEAGGKAEVNLDAAIAQGNQALQTITDTRAHPGRKYGTGYLGWVPGIPGTEQRGFVNLVDQLKGKAFLEAYTQLKGTGSISEAEGAKATQAIARLDRAQTEKDFDTALNDLETIVKKGLVIARQKAQMGGTPPAQMPAPNVRVGPPLNPSKDQARVGSPQQAAPQGEFQNGTRARNPSTGEIIEYRDGQWYKVQ